MRQLVRRRVVQVEAVSPGSAGMSHFLLGLRLMRHVFRGYAALTVRAEGIASRDPAGAHPVVDADCPHLRILVAPPRSGRCIPDPPDRSSSSRVRASAPTSRSSGSRRRRATPTARFPAPRVCPPPPRDRPPVPRGDALVRGTIPRLRGPDTRLRASAFRVRANASLLRTNDGVVRRSDHRLQLLYRPDRTTARAPRAPDTSEPIGAASPCTSSRRASPCRTRTRRVSTAGSGTSASTRRGSSRCPTPKPRSKPGATTTTGCGPTAASPIARRKSSCWP